LASILPQTLLQSLNGVKGFDKEYFEEVHASGEQVTSIRINPLKPNNLTKVNCKTVIPWCQHGFYLNERPFFTFDPLFHGGAYYVQEASSMFLWQVLKQTVGTIPNRRVLDLCAAPGGKSTLLASYFTNGLVVANEVIKTRAGILVENITKWGSSNVIVTNNDPKHFQKLQGFFDVVVVDAPCSGSGLFRKDSNAINEWSEENVHLCSQRQQRIIADIMPCLKEGGVLIYSTCSYSKEEDEEIMDWMMEEFDVLNLRLKLEDSWGIVETVSDKQKACGYRFFPNRLAGEGFFIAAFRKGQQEDRGYYSFKQSSLILPNKKELEFIRQSVSLPLGYTLFKNKTAFKVIEEAYINDLQLLALHLYIKKAGVELGEIKGKDFIPSHTLAVSVLPKTGFNQLEVNEEQALEYLRKKEVIASEAIKGWNLVTYCGLPLGWIKVLPNRINNYYPAEWRILKS